MPPRIFLTEYAFEHHWPAIVAVAPGARPVVARSEERCVAEIGWITFDVWSDPPPIGPDAWLELLGELDGLTWCHTSAAGVDAPHYQAMLRRGVRLSTSRVTTDAVADVAVRGALDALQQATRWRENQGARIWRRHEFREMCDTTWLVIGLGSIGHAIAQRAHAFGAKVIGSRRSPHGDEPCDVVIRPDEVELYLPAADVIVICAPASRENYHLVDESFLGKLKADAILINVARGSLVDEEALLTALNAGRLDAAVLDTFAIEPLPPQHPFWSHERVSVTPHNAAGGRGAPARALDAFLENLRHWLEGAPLANEVLDVLPRS